MAEYRLRLDPQEEEDESRRRTLDEISAFAAKMDGRPLAVVTLDAEQSELWDQEGEIDYQDEFGREITRQVSDGVTETVVIRDVNGLPVALAALDEEAGWQGLGIDKRLRLEVATMLMIDEDELE